jgi:membrane-associated protease RseP (regulator of RpoE activity)
VSSQDYSPAPYPFYAENGAAEVYPFPVPRRRERYWLYGLLFAATLLTATITGAAMQADFDRNLPFDLENSFPLYLAAWRHPAILLQGLPFSLTLLSILLAHEFGHYLAAVYHRVDASLPYFMPSPFLGTFGAFIRVRSPIYSKRVLFDIGISGPLAGFVFLLPALSIGLAFSKVIPNAAHQGSIQFGVPALQWLLQQAIFPGVRSVDIYLHPIARAAWVGMFATAMNLLPIGQLDGGHILYSFFPQRHRQTSKAICLLMLIPLLVMGGRHIGLNLLPGYDMWIGWSVWGLVLLWLGRRHPVVHDPTELTPGRRTLGILALIIFILCFILEPIGAGGL